MLLIIHVACHSAIHPFARISPSFRISAGHKAPPCRLKQIQNAKQAFQKEHKLLVEATFTQCKSGSAMHSPAAATYFCIPYLFRTALFTKKRAHKHPHYILYLSSPSVSATSNSSCALSESRESNFFSSRSLSANSSFIFSP